MSPQVDLSNLYNEYFAEKQAAQEQEHRQKDILFPLLKKTDEATL